MIPHVLNREEVIHLLFADPLLYQKLVQDEHSGDSALSKEDLTIKVDVAKELEKLDSLSTFEQSFWEGPEVDLTPILDLTNQLTRTFAVYLGNAATLFDREFEEFMNKFRDSLQRAGMTLKAVDFALEDVAAFETNARDFLSAGEFLQSFTFDRLLSSQIMMKQVVNLPSEGFTLRQNLIRQALQNPKLASPMVKFAIRISYVSQGAWDDLFTTLLKQILEKQGECSIARLVELVEQDIMFSCNLLCRSYTEIREMSAPQRRSAIEDSLRHYQDRAGLLMPASQDR